MTKKDTYNIILDGKKVDGFAGESILELAKRHGTQIPTLCHDPRLEPYSSCFLCVVEVEGARTLQTACSTKITEGMVINTDNEKVRKARKTALDLLLSNHYADCLGPCKQTCPAGVDVQGYISLIDKKMYSEAIALIKETNPLPAICGRVCVRPCEAACRRNLLDEGAAVGIDYLKRFAADKDLEAANHFIPEIEKSTGKKIAIIGAGPGGLSAAYFLQQKGHQCDIFEAAPKPGGWLRYGIPEYRLPNDLLDKEIQTITEIGVNIFCNKNLGENLSYSEIENDYDATILTIGSQKGTLIGCKGDDAENVYSGIDFLRNMEITGKPADFTGKKIAVVGGGNTAMDCCRTSLRCGSTDVKVVYRRTEKEMPANPIEIHESKLEGVEYMFLHNPVEVKKDDNGKLKSMTLIKMELGEPDASGRRRPVPVEDSEFEMEFDYILAAIGQKTVVNFINDINKNSKSGELKINRWGDIDANSKTLQTGISSVFAAGDGVTGPATIIEAIAQAKTASLSCHQFLMGEEIKPAKEEFISRKENFKTQEVENYKGNFKSILREEMPTLEAGDRVNFKEVELGYAGEEIALGESTRCLECGCAEYFTCDLKKYSTEYEVEQKKFEGEFNEYKVDFSHPFIEIDSNKCILCSRCIRICKEVVGANALGLIQRGFDTYVAPALGDSLLDTKCESCGLCISACPTGAMSENFKFKPGPIKSESFETINNFGSIGESLNVHQKNNFVMQITGKNGLVNKDGNIGKFAKFGYNYLNNSQRITKPLLRSGNEFKEISFAEAFDIIREKSKDSKAEQTAFFAGGRLTNEEQYLIQKIARVGAKTTNIGSFQNLNGDIGKSVSSESNTSFEEIKNAGKIFLIGSNLNHGTNSVAGFYINNARIRYNVPVTLISNDENASMIQKTDSQLMIKSYYHFIKAVNHYFVANNLQNQMFINDNCLGFDEYKTDLLSENYDILVEKSGIESKEISQFAVKFNNEMKAILVFEEAELCDEAISEIRNLALISGKLGKTNQGIIALKESCNSQGLIDNGISTNFGPGNQSLDNEDYQNKIKTVWKVDELPKSDSPYISEKLDNLSTIFIFGEDPVGCSEQNSVISKSLQELDFLVVQENIMTETAKIANLVLPASFAFENSGSYTNTQKIVQNFENALSGRTEISNFEQIVELGKVFGVNGISKKEEVIVEFAKLLQQQSSKFKFIVSSESAQKTKFIHNCDGLVKHIENSI